MKKYFLNLLLISLAVTALQSCDYISNPIPPVNPFIDDTSTCTTPNFPVITAHVKKTLVEDYTGHTCTNCPRAAEKLHIVDSLYPGKIIGLGVHVGGFAEPYPSTHIPTSAESWAYHNDYRTSTGDVYDALLKMSVSLPKLTVNRAPYNGTSFTHRKEWYQVETAVAAVVNNPAQAEIQIINNFDPSTKKLCSHAKVEFLNAQTGTYKLVMLLVQDSIQAWQFNIGVNDSLYMHRHVLRDAINSTWGDSLATNPSANQTHITKFAYKIPNDYRGVPTDIHHMYVVAYLYNTSTYEVIQAEEKKVME